MRRPRIPPVAADVVVAGIVFDLGLWRELVLSDQPTRLLHAPVGVYLAGHALSAVALLFRRRQPLAVGLGVAALAVATPTYAPIVAAYTVGLCAPQRRRMWMVLAALLAGWAVGAGSGRWPPTSSSPACSRSRPAPCSGSTSARAGGW